MITQEEINRRFTYHPPTQEAQVIFETIRNKARALTEYINMFVPEGREQAVAFTKIEECVMWANAGVARKQTPVVPEIGNAY